MTERANRRDLIVDTAAKLFIEQGYQSTSIRQIADGVGCTEAALYYHFKDGKRELFQAVVEGQMPSLQLVLEECSHAASMNEFVMTYVQAMSRMEPLRIEKLRWILSEFPNLNEVERAHFHTKQLIFHDGLAEIIARFVDTQERADKLAWVMMCAGFGYGQLFWNMHMHSVADFNPQAFAETLASIMKQD